MNISKVSIVIPSFNVEKYIIKCLNSIKNQTYKKFEVIIIDDSFKDSTRKLIKDFIIEDERFTLIELEENIKYSVSQKRNIGIEKSTGDFLLFVDSDDYINHSTIETSIKFALDNDVDMCMFNIKQVEPNGEEILTSNICENNFVIDYNKDNFIDNFSKYWLGVRNVHFSWNKLFKSSVIKNNNIFFSENVYISEDMLFNYLVLDKCKNVGYIKDVLYYYVRHESSITKNNKNAHLIVPSYWEIYKTLNETFTKSRYTNSEIIKPILFIKLMTQAMGVFKSKNR